MYKWYILIIINIKIDFYIIWKISVKKTKYLQNICKKTKYLNKVSVKKTKYKQKIKK